MPEHPQDKHRPHPWRQRPSPADEPPPQRRSPCAYAELQVTTNFTFLTGASHPEEFVEQAAHLGHSAIAVTDRNSLAGVVRAHVAAKAAGLPLAVGVRLDLLLDPPARDEPAETARRISALVYPTDRASYGRLCALLTLGKRRAPKAHCYLWPHDLAERQEGLLAVALPPPAHEGLAGFDEVYLDALRGLRAMFDDDRFSLGASRCYDHDDDERLGRIAQLATHIRAPLVALNDVHAHTPRRRALQDVLTCIRHGCTLDNAGLRLLANAERHLKPAQEMARLFASFPGAVERTVQIARRAGAFSLDQLRYEYPEETCPAGSTPMEHLTALTWKGAAERYPGGVPEKVDRQIRHELALIEELRYAPYFLTVHEIVVFARARGILCQGRGAAANSAVCYCLAITAVDPSRVDLLFERFISRERNEPPDIDIDFEHERREEVIQHIYSKYGRHRAALTAEVITYRGRSAVREVGKALGLSLDMVDRLSKSMDWWERGSVKPERLRELGLDPTSGMIARLAELSAEILGFPRHLSQHVGGFVITRGPLSESVPIENAAMPDRTVIEWDKDDIEALGMLKIDVLGLGMLTCLRKAFDLVRDTDQQRGETGPALEFHTVPPEDPAVYDAICRADTIGVFQIESRAQMTMLPRLRPRCYYDLVIEVAIVRPGPIQGKMVHPYLRRRRGQEAVAYPDDTVRTILARTLGVPLFQEQAMALAIHCAGFTPGEADALRRAIAAWKSKQKIIYTFGEKIVAGMTARGYSRDFAERCFEQIKGFSEYGFPESHAASFALIVYVSAWLKRHRPAEFAAALLNSQPMGFYAPAQIVRDAAEHGVEVRPVDVLHSAWDCTLEDLQLDRGPALRLGMRLVSGLREDEARALADAVRSHGPFDTIEALRRAGGVRVAPLRRLAGADAFQSMGLDRQQALWQIRRLRDERLPLFEQVETRDPREPPAALPEMAPFRQVAWDYAAAGLSLKAHPMSFLRERMDRAGVTPNAELRDQARWPTGSRIAVSGVTLVRQRPATASGVVFITLEDETGIANLVMRPKIYQRYRAAARHGVALLARGHVERDGDVVHVVTTSVQDLARAAPGLVSASRDFH